METSFNCFTLKFSDISIINTETTRFRYTSIDLGSLIFQNYVQMIDLKVKVKSERNTSENI